MQFASLGSGSKGNATLVRAGDTLVMIDCGFSVRETTRRMARLGLSPEDLDAILVTHEHSDHVRGVAALSRAYSIPVHATHGTGGSGRLEGSHTFNGFNCGDSFGVGDLGVYAVAVPHDAAEPCQFRIDWQGRSLGILTDLGSITPHVLDSFGACRSLVLEFNHDLPTLLAGAYPHFLKRRVGGDRGHLNNDQAVELLSRIDYRGLDHLVVAHISESNNSRGHAEGALLSLLDSLDDVVFADQKDGFGWLSLM
ncbi:MAG: MBL fold metallo-hydrolase [Halioglobus sp.]|nr:MBL fold metallo-hydrolase [Halioglobus sp.]